MKHKNIAVALIGYLLGVVVGACGWDRAVTPPHQVGDLYAILVCMAFIVGILFFGFLTFYAQED